MNHHISSCAFRTCLTLCLCFGSIHAWSQEAFTSQPVPDSVWVRMQGKSYHDNPYIRRADLRYLRLQHYDLQGQAMVCHRRIAAKLIVIFRTLFQHRYPIERIQLADDYDADDERQMRANNTSCFCYRTVARSKQLSKHAQGLAVDLNPLYNPYYKQRSEGTVLVQPANALPYCDRTATFPYKIDRRDLAYRLFTQHGFRWGGAWHSCKDWQHFEY